MDAVVTYYEFEEDSIPDQCRFKRPDGRSHRQSTGKASLEQAIPRACDLYDEARYRLRLGLAHRTHSIAHIAQLCVAELRQQIDLRGKKTSLNDYVSVIMAAELPICLLRV